MTLKEKHFAPPIWDRGDPIDPEMYAFTAGDDWFWDRRLAAVDLEGSLAHVDGLLAASLIEAADHGLIRKGLEGLLASHRAGDWSVEEGDEDVHSAVERRLIEAIGEAGQRLHTGRSRNDQVAVDLRLWLRDASGTLATAIQRLVEACASMQARHGTLSLPGYTHLQRAMPSTVGHWIGAFAAAFRLDLADLAGVGARLRTCPLGSGAGYGVPLDLDRAGVAAALGFEAPEEPVTLTQLGRGRAELAYMTVLEGLALDLGKLACDLWLFATAEFGFVRLPVALTTGSSLMPHKRNPDLIELLRAHCRQVVAERAALLDAIRDLPSGYHRDFQLIKPALFRAHDRLAAALPLVVKLLDQLEFDGRALAAASADARLGSTERALRQAAAGVPFREAYRQESRLSPATPYWGDRP